MRQEKGQRHHSTETCAQTTAGMAGGMQMLLSRKAFETRRGGDLEFTSHIF